MKKVVLILLIAIIAHDHLLAIEINLDKTFVYSIQKVTNQKRVVYPVNKLEERENRNKLQKWLAHSFAIKNATVRESKRFKRTSYKLVDKPYNARFINEKLFPLKNNPLMKINKKKMSESAVVLYREGPTYFKYLNFKEKKANTPLSDKEIIALAKEYIFRNNFVKETGLDKIGDIEVCNAMLNEEGTEGNSDQDFLMMQNVVFRRYVDGKQVINSQISVGIFPDTKEIIELNHFNWTPVEESNRTILDKTELEAEKLSSTAEIISKVKRMVSYLSGTGTKATIKNASEAWFQAEDELIPILIVEYDVYIYADEEPRPYRDMISLVSGDDVFMKDYRDDYKPSHYPEW